jgi:hypothetical protein
MIDLRQPNGNSLDSVQTLDVLVTLVLQCRPVELVDHLICCGLITETIRYGFTDVVGGIGGVPHDFWSSVRSQDDDLARTGHSVRRSPNGVPPMP